MSPVLSILYLLNVHVAKCTFNVYSNPLKDSTITLILQMKPLGKPLRDVEKFARSHPKKR